MKILVTGATGFTGSYVVPLLLQDGHQVSCFVRKQSDLHVLPQKEFKTCYGDLADPDSLTQALKGMDALVNIASLGFGHAGNIVNAVHAAGVSRSVFISTTAIFTQLNARSKSVRTAAEKAVIESGLDFTILRPTMIYGSKRDRNMCRLVDYLRRWPVIPILGDGQSLQQPVYVGDVANAVVQVLKTDRTVRKAYNIAGKEPLTCAQVIDTICVLLKRNVRKVYVPYRPIVQGLTLLEQYKLFFPIKAEQILRLNENKTFDIVDATRDFNYQPCTFAQGMSLEVASL